jgi:hypothetical protein
MRAIAFVAYSLLSMLGIYIIVTDADGTACLIFGDGFEDGATNAWSGVTP